MGGLKDDALVHLGTSPRVPAQEGLVHYLVPPSALPSALPPLGYSMLAL
jgi:hypothetical protein